MNRNRNLLYLILTFAMLLTLITGCAAKADETPPPESDVSLTESSESDASVDYASFSYSDGIDENGFLKGVKALDYVEGLNYRGLPIPGDIHRIPEDSVQAEIDNMLGRYAFDEQITDRAVADGDTVNIDYVGSVDGVPFDGGSTAGAGTNVTIGVTSYIDDFLEQLIGHTPGETINVDVTFPDVYQNESLQGKDAVFVTTINYIVESKQPELTDDFVKTNFSELYDWETVAGMKEGIPKKLQEAAIKSYVQQYLMNEVPVISIPDSLTDYQERMMLRYYLDGAESYGMELDEFLTSYVGVSGVDELIEDNRDTNAQGATYTLVSQAVAEDANISVSEDDMIKYFEDYSEYEEQYGLPYLKRIVLFQKVIDYIADNSVLE